MNKYAFILDLTTAEQKCSYSKNVVVVFEVRFCNGRHLPVYLATSECLLSIVENIKSYRAALKEYLYFSGYSYGSLICVGYVK